MILLLLYFNFIGSVLSACSIPPIHFIFQRNNLPKIEQNKINNGPSRWNVSKYAPFFKYAEQQHTICIAVVDHYHGA